MERIKKLSEELLNACIDQEVTAIVILEEQAEAGKVANGIYRVGRKKIHISQLLSLCDTLSDNCNCPRCQNRRASEQEREGAAADNEEVFSMLAKMMKGDSDD